MPILPVVDLLILMGTASLGVGFLLKAVALSTHYRPTVLGLSSLDFALIAAVCLGLALTLVARTWMKLNDPQLVLLQQRLAEEKALRRARQIEEANSAMHAAEDEVSVDAEPDAAAKAP
jgi:Na+/melibiose symporter-like transporter